MYQRRKETLKKYYLSKKDVILKKNQDKRNKEKEISEEDLKDWLFALVYKLRPNENGNAIRNPVKRIKRMYKSIYGRQSVMKNLDWLYEIKKTEEWIQTSELTLATKAGYLQSVCYVCKYHETYKQVYNEYWKFLTILRKLESDRRKKTLTLYGKVKKMDMNYVDFKKLYKNELNIKNKALMAVFSLIPPRDEVSWGKALVIDTLENLDPSYNYIYCEDVEFLGKTITKCTPIKVIFNTHTSFNKYGVQEMDIEGELADILKKHIVQYNLKPGRYLFCNSRYKPYEKFSNIVSRIFRRHINEKVNVTLIRKAYVEYEDKPENWEELMGL